jgi:hypothetical protein
VRLPCAFCVQHRPKHHCLVSLLLLHLSLCSVLLCVLDCCLCAALRMGGAGRDIRIRAPPSRAPRALSVVQSLAIPRKNSHEIMHVCVLYLLLIRPAESPDVLLGVLRHRGHQSRLAKEETRSICPLLAPSYLLRQPPLNSACSVAGWSAAADCGTHKAQREGKDRGEARRKEEQHVDAWPQGAVVFPLRC